VAVKTQEKVRSAVARVGEELTEKAWTVGRDRKIAARRVGVKLWGVLTGERPPLPR
jgi:hypothetical protein